MARKNIGLDAELNPEAYDDEQAPPQAVPSTPAPLPATSEFAAMVAALAEAIKSGTTGAILETKEKPRSRDEADFERRSHYNLVGDKDRPRPALACPTYYAVLNEDDPSREPTPYVQLNPSTMTYDELVAVNGLPEGAATVEMNDGSREPFAVYVKRDPVSKTPVRTLLALRKRCYEKDRRNMVPNLRQMARQIQDAHATV